MSGYCKDCGHQHCICDMPPATCKWEYDDIHDYYETECENAFVFIEGRNTDNGFIYCPYCGRKIEESPQ